MCDKRKDRTLPNQKFDVGVQNLFQLLLSEDEKITAGGNQRYIYALNGEMLKAVFSLKSLC